MFNVGDRVIVKGNGKRNGSRGVVVQVKKFNWNIYPYRRVLYDKKIPGLTDESWCEIQSLELECTPNLIRLESNSLYV